MATIDTMTDSGQPQPAAPQHPATSPPEPPAATADSAAAAQDRDGTARQPRPLLIPLPTAVTAALVAGLFGLLFLNLNSLNDNITTLHDDITTLRHDTNNSIDTLRDDMNGRIDSLRDDMNGRIDALDAKIDNKVDSLRDEMLAVLLDHTDRLARIETHLDLRPHTDTTDP